MRYWRAATIAAALLGGCTSTPRVAGPAAVPPPGVVLPADTTIESARGLRLTRVALPAVPDPALALAALRRSCTKLVVRSDPSGLTEPGDWSAPCATAATASDAATFFATALVPVRVADGSGLNTGYYEPELAGARVRGPGFTVPLYRRPPELVELDLGAFVDSLKGRKIRGRVSGGGFVPYHDRAAIEDGVLANRGLELVWAADIHAAFFLEIQGSGRVRLPDGEIVRVGYDGQNGREYVAIGKLLRERNVLAPGQATMQGIIGWMQAQPDRGKALMRENRSKIFFRELPPGPPGLGPPGALGVPLTPRVSVAVDPRFVPLGGPLVLASRGDADFTAVMVAQDTGGAIKGANRLDVFWGAGDDAARIAGGMAVTGSTILLLPPASVARLGL